MPDHKHDNCSGRFALAWARPLLLPFRIIRRGVPIWLSFREPDTIVCVDCDREYPYSSALWAEARLENEIGAMAQISANVGRRLLDGQED